MPILIPPKVTMTPKRLRYLAMVFRDQKQTRAAEELEQFALELELMGEGRPERKPAHV